MRISGVSTVHLLIEMLILQFVCLIHMVLVKSINVMVTRWRRKEWKDQMSMTLKLNYNYSGHSVLHVSWLVDVC